MHLLLRHEEQVLLQVTPYSVASFHATVSLSFILSQKQLFIWFIYGLFQDSICSGGVKVKAAQVVNADLLIDCEKKGLQTGVRSGDGPKHEDSWSQESRSRAGESSSCTNGR